MMINSTKLAHLFGAIALSMSFAGSTATIDATDRGWYDELGTHQTFNLNYFVGRSEMPGLELRNFFVFDLTGISGFVTSASLRLFNPSSGFTSVDPTEVLNIRHVGTSAAFLAGGTAGVAGFTDLGDGTLYATYVASETDNGTFITIALNAAAIADVNAGRGGLMAFGGSLSSLDPFTSEAAVFSSTNDGVLSLTQLVIETSSAAPEPGNIAIFGLGVMILAGLRRHRQTCP